MRTSSWSYEPAEPVGESPTGLGSDLPLSARNEDQLREAAIRLANFLRQNRVDLNAVAHTHQHGRKSFEQRVAIVARTQDELPRS
jgi:acyl transferase domain-containing protein